MSYNSIVYRKYRLKDYRSKCVTIGTHPNGFLFIATEKLANFYGEDNIFFSILEVEIVLGHELEPVMEKPIIDLFENIT